MRYPNILKIAYQILINSKPKFIGMLISATFSAFIIMQQPSIYQGVSDRLIHTIQTIKPVDLWIMSASTANPDQPTHFDPIDRYRILSIPGVAWVQSLHRSWIWMKHTKTQKSLLWDVIGVESESLLGLPNKMQQGIRSDIRDPRAVIVDGYTLNQLNLHIGDRLTENNRTWIIKGITYPIRTYAYQPKLYILNSHLPIEYANGSFFLVKIHPHANLEKIAKEIYLRTHYKALTPTQFSQETLQFFNKSTPIIIMFSAVAIGGFFIGLVIMWQIFSNFILTHLHQLGMLKLLGVSNNQLIMMVLFQASIIGGIAYLTGLSLVIILSLLLKNTDIACHLTPSIAFFGFMGTVCMIFLASYLSILKVLHLDSIELCHEHN